MTIVYNGKGTAGESTGAVPFTVSPPAHSVGDFLLLCIMSDGTVDPAAPTGWTSAGIGKDDGFTATSGVQINFFYRIATGTTTGQDQAPVVGSATFGLTAGVILSFSGVNPVSPIDATGTSWSDVTATNTKTYTNFATVANAAMVLWFLSSSINATCTIANTSAGAITNFVSVGSLWTSGTSSGGLGFSHGDNASAGNPGGTRTGNWVASNAVGVAFSLAPAPVTHTIAAVVGTVAADSGSINIKNKIGVALTAGLLQKVTGAANVKNKIGVALTAGLLQKVTGAANVKNKIGVALTAGLLQKVTGAANVSVKDGAAIAGVLGSVTGAVAVTVRDGMAVTGVLGSVTGDVAITVRNAVTLDAMLGAVTGVVHMTETVQAAVDGLLGGMQGDIHVAVHDEVSVDALLGAVTGDVQIAFGQAVSVDAVIVSVTGDVSIILGVGMTMDGLLGSVTGAVAVDNTNKVRVSAAIEGISAFEGEIAVRVLACYNVADDTRELILRRLVEVLNGVVPTQRNDVALPDSDLPRIIVLDGDETIELGRPAKGPNLVTLLPEIYLTVSADSPEGAGMALTGYEPLIREAILADSTLQALVHNKSIRYVGSDTAVAEGRASIGQMSFEFAFDYALRLEEPCEPPDTVVDMSASQREAILQAIQSIAEQTEGVASFARNDMNVPEDDSVLPRVLMLDGNEASDANGWYRGRDPNGPHIMRMEPEIYIVLKEGLADTGAGLNRVRLMLLRGLLTDPLLAGLSHNGDIRYEGCQTALAAGRSLTGEMGMVLSIARVSKA